MQGDYMAARPLLEESLALFREIGDRAGTAEAQIGLAQVLQFQGDLPAARSLFEEVLTIARELGFIEDMASCLRGLGMVACGQEDYAAARSQLTEALAIFSELGAMWHISSCLTMLAWVAAMQRLPQQAARLFGAGEASRDAIGMATPVAFRAKYEHYLAIAQE
jgi:tetratricopeptide (TPR) repeat protein